MANNNQLSEWFRQGLENKKKIIIAIFCLSMFLISISSVLAFCLSDSDCNNYRCGDGGDGRGTHTYCMERCISASCVISSGCQFQQCRKSPDSICGSECSKVVWSDNPPDTKPATCNDCGTTTCTCSVSTNCLWNCGGACIGTGSCPTMSCPSLYYAASGLSCYSYSYPASCQKTCSSNGICQACTCSATKSSVPQITCNECQNLADCSGSTPGRCTPKCSGGYCYNGSCDTMSPAVSISGMPTGWSAVTNVSVNNVDCSDPMSLSSTNFALNKPVTISSMRPGVPAQAVDGDVNTRWEGRGNGWLEVDLTVTYLLNKIITREVSLPAGARVNIKLFKSGNEIYSAAVSSTTQTFEFSPVLTDKIRVTYDNILTPYIYELEAYGLVNGSGCNSSSYKLKVYPTNPGSCSTNYNDYDITSRGTISTTSWICAAAKDNAGKVNFSTPFEFKVDSINPVLGNILHFPLFPKVNEPVNISASAGDALSGIKNITIYVDGQIVKNCTEPIPCQEINNPLTGMLIKSVTGYQEDIIIIVPNPEWCGDGSCNAGETCSSCPADCGTCPPQLCMICNVSLSYVKAGTHSYNITVYDNAGNVNASAMKNFTVMPNSGKNCSYNTNNTGKICGPGESCIGGVFINTSDGSGANAGTINPGNAKCCDGVYCSLSTVLPFCIPPIGTEYNISIADCRPAESKITNLVQVSIPGLECCAVTPTLTMQGFNVYWSRQTSGYAQLTEASEGDSLYCIATTTGPATFEVKKPSASIPTKQVTTGTGGIMQFSVIADETGTFTCKATSGAESKIATIKVTEVEKSAVALPFFGFFEFIMALMLIIIYLVGKAKKSGGSK